MKISKNLNIKSRSNQLVIYIRTEIDSYKETAIDWDMSPVSHLTIEVSFPEFIESFKPETNVYEKLCVQIQDICDKHQYESDSVTIIGSRISGSIAMFIAYKLNLNYVAIGPNINQNSDNKNTLLLLRMGFPVGNFGSIITDENFKGHGKVIYSHYDVYNGSYNENILKFLETFKNIQLVILEDYFYGMYIRQAKFNIAKLVVEEFNNLFSALSIGLNLKKYHFTPENKNSLKTHKYENEKNYHLEINGLNRCIKYRQEICNTSDVLAVTFCGIMGPQAFPGVNHDNSSTYAVSFLRNSPVNSLFIRSTLALNGGFYLYDNGEDYASTLILSLIEEKRNELGISKEKVILIGPSAGGTTAFSYAKKGGYKHVFAIQPCINPTDKLSLAPQSNFNVSVDNKEQLDVVIKNVIKKDFDFYSTTSDINGVIVYTNKDDDTNMRIDEEFKNLHPNIQFVEIGSDFQEEIVSHKIVIPHILKKYASNRKLIMKYIEEKM